MYSFTKFTKLTNSKITTTALAGLTLVALSMAVSNCKRIDRGATEESQTAAATLNHLKGLQVLGSVNGKRPRKLTLDEFRKMRSDEDGGSLGTWYGLAVQVDSKNPIIHIIDTKFYGDEAKLGFSVKYGTHEGYARRNDFAKSSYDFNRHQLQGLDPKVLVKAAKKAGTSNIGKIVAGWRNRAELVGAIKIMPFTMHIPLNAPEVSGVKFVFQNRRYRYFQSSQQFANALKKCIEAVGKSLYGGKAAAGAIHYARSNSHRRPNSKSKVGRADIAALKGGSSPVKVFSEAQLTKLDGTVVNPVRILNLGPDHPPGSGRHEAFGFLRYIDDVSPDSDGPRSVNSLSPLDIPLFESLPERVNPVAAIIVKEDQGALSHVNILARNRGTLNISLTSENLDDKEIAKLISGYSGDLAKSVPVKITVKGGAVTMERSTEKAVLRFYDEKQDIRGRLTIPETRVKDPSRWVVNPSEEGLTVEDVGAKAANYGLVENLLEKTFPGAVLPGRAIGFRLYREVIKIPVTIKIGQETRTVSAQALIDKLLESKDGEPRRLQMSQGEVDAELAQIQAAIQAIPLANIPVVTRDGRAWSVIDELAEMLNHPEFAEVGRIRLRSSTNCEDLPRFNGAGLYTSEGVTVSKKSSNPGDIETAVAYLKSKGYPTNPAPSKVRVRRIKVEDTWADIKSVLSSLWLPRAFHEREYFGIDHKRAGISIQINPAFSDKWLLGIRRSEAANGVVVFKKTGGKEQIEVSSQPLEHSVTNPMPGELPETILVSQTGNSTFKLEEVSSRSRIMEDPENPGSPIKEGFVFLKDAENLRQDAETTEMLKVLINGTREIWNRRIADKDKEDFGIDIEFKVLLNENTGKSTMHIKQARPLYLR